jgi:hypothetical protein
MKQSRSGRLSLWWFWTKSSGTRTKNKASNLLEEDGHRGLKKGWGRPAWADWPRWPASPLGSIFLQCTPCSFVALWPRAPRGCTAQVLSSTLLLAWLILPLDCFCFESLPCSLASHASTRFQQNKALAAPHACPLHVVSEKCWRGIPWWIMEHAKLS